MIMNEFVIFFLIAVAVFFIIETIVRRIVLQVNQDFQWLIVEKDKTPILDKHGLSKFISHGFDPELGWVRKPNTSHDETGKSGKTNWTINQFCARTNPNFDNLESNTSCYGDSFTFSRQVNDDETWVHYLSEFTNSNVINFGVGNYGVDQALLRLKREFPKHPTKIVIMGVVPETICRIVSVWKHYYEYGNTFGFKPRFILKNNSLNLIENIIDSKDKFEKYQNYLEDINRYDFFYKNKFLKEKISFPYCITILKNLRRNFGIINWVQKINQRKKNNFDCTDIEWNTMKIIMKINLDWRVKLFQDNETCELLKQILVEYANYGKKQNFKPVFIFLPQKDDILFIKKNFNFYHNFVNELKKIENLFCIDITKDMINIKEIDRMFSDNNEYGGHYSKDGNQKVAELIFNELKILNGSE
tara:strand:- start:448 stop:1695 length:1248 start_codon:yes stop_codon:yes gene_type:complete